MQTQSRSQTDPSDGLAALEGRGSTAETFGIPLAVLAELTHRCPLQCPYCSNPVELDRGGSELTTDEWKKVLSELAEIGVLQIHFSGGEPTARKDLVELVQHASDVGLYSNLITSAVLLTREKLAALADAGLCHVQISFQGNEPVVADRVAGFKDAHAKKLEVAKWTRELDLPLTVNAVMHRQNLYQLPDIIQMAVDLDADRLEVANVQYYGWALKNRAALMPTLEQIEETSRIVEEAQARLKGTLAIDYVVPDYYALRPKKCMGGWGRQFFNISPAGKILPCHAAESITGLEFVSVRSNHSIAWIWQNSEAFNRYRGTGWMPEPCKSCEFKEVDFGGCRCQAFALTGDAGNTDPACTLSPPMSGSSRSRARKRPATTTASSIAISQAARRRRTVDMAPDADAARSRQRADPFAPLTSELLAGRRRPRDPCRERRPRRRHSRRLSAWRARQRMPARSPPAVRSRALPRGAVRSARRRPQPPEGPSRAQHAAASDRGHGNDPREIRLRALDGRRRLLGRDAGAGLCAGASRPRLGHRVARDVPRHPQRTRRRVSRSAAAVLSRAQRRFHRACCPRPNARSRSMPTGGAFSIPIAAVHSARRPRLARHRADFVGACALAHAARSSLR